MNCTNTSIKIYGIRFKWNLTAPTFKGGLPESHRLSIAFAIQNPLSHATAPLKLNSNDW